jgi:hypothetical protein
MWARRRSDLFHRAFLGSIIPPKHRASGTGTGARFHFSIVGAKGCVLPTATAPLFGRGTVSGAARTAPSHHRRTRHRLRSRRKPTSPSSHPRLFIRSLLDIGLINNRAATHFPACDLPMPSAWPDRQPVWTQYRRCFPAPLVAPLQRRLVRLEPVSRFSSVILVRACSTWRCFGRPAFATPLAPSAHT